MAQHTHSAKIGYTTLVDPQLQLFCEVTWFFDQLDTENSTWASVKAMAWEKGGGGHYFFFRGKREWGGAKLFFPLAWMCRVFFLAGSLDSSKATWSGQVDRSGIFEVLFWKLDHWELWNCWISPTLMLPFSSVLHDRFVGKVPIYLVAFFCMVVSVCFPRYGCKKERIQETITLDDKERFFWDISRVSPWLLGCMNPVASHGPKFSAEIRTVVCFLKVKTTGKSNFQNQDLSESFMGFFSKLSDFRTTPSGFFPSKRAQWLHLQAPEVAGRLPQLPQHSSPEELQVGWEFSHCPRGYGSKLKTIGTTDVSLFWILTIQLLGYQLLTHTHVSIVLFWGVPLQIFLIFFLGYG